MNVEQKFINYNFSPRTTLGFTTKPKYIVIHDTGNTDNGANAIMHYNYFNGGDRDSSADFFVDSNRIIQTVDYAKNYSWAVGDGGGTYGITNKNSVSIEMCINADGDLNLTIANTVELVVNLMEALKIPLECVVRHYDASRKMCPRILSKNGWEGWNKFLKKIKDLQSDRLFEKVLKLYSSGKEYWLENTKEGKMCKGDWAKALMLRIYLDKSG